MDILSGITLLQANVTIISKSLEARSAIPLGLGYNWGSGPAVKDNVLLIDAMDRSTLFPMELLRSSRVRLLSRFFVLTNF